MSDRDSDRGYKSFTTKMDKKRRDNGRTKQEAKGKAPASGPKTEEAVLGFKVQHRGKGGFDRMENKDEERKGHSKVRDKAAIYEGRENKRSVGSRPQHERGQPNRGSVARLDKGRFDKTTVRGDTILHTYKAGETLNRRPR
jgi:hypothetical protein